MFAKSFTTTANTLGSVKAKKCDVLQNLALHVEGGADQVRNVIEKLDWNAVNALLSK
jgi:hypothetical protein